MALKKDLTQQNSKTMMKWGYWAFGLFLIVIAILVNIGLLSNRRSRTSIEEKLSIETAAYSSKVGASLETLIAEARGAASAIGVEGLSDSEAVETAARSLTDNSTIAYLAVITDEAGVGYASTGENVDLSSMEYYYDGAGAMYAYTENDGIVGTPAFVVAVPYKSDGVVSGYVYMYSESSTIYKYLPSKSYGSSLAFALINSKGTIIDSIGTNSYFNTGDNIFTLLGSSSTEGLTVPQVKAKVEKLVKAFFYASYGAENRAIAISPIGASDWELVTIINKTYVNAVVKNNMSSIIRMIVFTIIALCIFVAFLGAMFFINKFRQKEESKDLEDKADTDLLTGLNNKIATERKIQEYMTDNPTTQSLMFLFDIDNFKKINDTMGHSFGDEVLRTLGHQLTNEFRVTDIIGRLGGDEFVVLLKNIKNDDQLEREGQRITALFHQFKAGDYVKYSATASIGAVVFPRDAKDFQSAYKAADKALYEAKRRGKNQLVFYSDNLSDVKSIKVDD